MEIIKRINSVIILSTDMKLLKEQDSEGCST